MKHLRQLTALVLFAFGLAQLLWSLPAFGAAAPGKIILGYAAPGARALPFWVAQDLGLFNKYGVDVESVFIRGAPILVAGLASGDIHVGSTGGSATLAPNASVTFYFNDHVVLPGAVGNTYVNTLTASGADDDSQASRTAGREVAAVLQIQRA
jgi:ABC-type nitrate/sulfonate/bicarbonate transport system substrate-binding protein